jgi:hypothetical protein
MRRTAAAMALAVTAAFVALVGLPAAPALAHAELDVGPYTVAIGFGTEPAYVGFPNSLEVIIHERDSGNAVENAADTLKAEVRFGSTSMNLSLEPNFDEDSGGSPGDYRAPFIPTAPGNYTFHMSGTIGSTDMDETVTSSPTTFASVTDPASIQFPSKIPSGTELSQKIDRVVPRVQAQAVAAASGAKHDAGSAKTFGIIGMVIGAIGAVAGAVALVRTRG